MASASEAFPTSSPRWQAVFPAACSAAHHDHEGGEVSARMWQVSQPRRHLPYAALNPEASPTNPEPQSPQCFWAARVPSTPSPRPGAGPSQTSCVAARLGQGLPCQARDMRPRPRLVSSWPTAQRPGGRCLWRPGCYSCTSASGWSHRL